MTEGDREAGSRPPSDVPAHHVQPLAVPVPVEDALCSTPSSDSTEDDQQFEEAARRLADKRLRDELAAESFSGPRYRWFQEELARYGTSMLQRWMYSGRVFTLIAELGFPASPTDVELEELRQDLDVREGLANMTVAVALCRFREHALIGGGWRHEGGASLTTYFMSFCLFVFPNEFRRHRAHRKKWPEQNGDKTAVIMREADYAADPAALAASKIDVVSQLKSLNERTRAIVALAMDDYSQAEIADFLDEPSARAVEGVLYRLRNQRKDLMGGGDR